MKPATTTLASLAALVILAGSASAQTGSLRLSWSNCDPIIQDLSFTGPGQVATLVGSAIGTASPHKAFRARILIQSGLPDAWRFDADGCNSGQVGLVTSALNKGCPAFQGTNPLAIFNYGYEVDGAGTATFDAINAYDLVAAPDPAVRTTVFQAKFDHIFSDFGPHDPLVACGRAELPICFALVYTEFLNPDLTVIPFDAIESDYVTWQDPANSTNCPGATQNETTTWGRVKGLYR